VTELPVTNEAVALWAARDSLAAYAVAQKQDYDLAPHAQLIIEHLEALERGDFKQLFVAMPPQNGKSTLCAQLLPSWWMGRHPHHHIIMSSYSQELVEDHSISCRGYLCSDFHRAIFPESELDDRYVAKHDFRTKRGGAVRAVGRGGSITGRGADLYVMDDLIKDKEEARSETERRKLWNWLNTVVLTRRRPDARLLSVGTRWDTDDVMGRELQEHGKQWKVLELPAIATRDEGWRKEGEALWPERYALEWLEDMRDRLPRDDWMALYQQRPTRDGDENCFSDDWFRLFKPKGDLSDARLMNGVIIGDPANKKKKNRDRSGVWVFGQAPDQNFYFFDGMCTRLGLSDRWKALKELHKKWASKFRRLHTFWEEFGGWADIEYFTERMGIENYRFHIERIGSNQVSKEQRIRDWGQGICKDLRVYWNENIPAMVDEKRVNLTEWLFENEWHKYPAVRHDDGIDSASYSADARFMKSFPKTSAQGQGIEEMLSRWKKRREGITSMGV
jgi:hypothetical protein